ncbi:MAG TPA: hypothetical protein VHK27_15050 [Gammaproteobacteria bacterium]|nr:hypothetical protein [Gammaproteobacteria bacterium]
MASKLFDRTFWESTLERAVIAGAGVLASTWGVNSSDIVGNIDIEQSVSIFLGVVVVDIVKSLIAPNFLKPSETTTEESPEEVTQRRGRHSKK